MIDVRNNPTAPTGRRHCCPEQDAIRNQSRSAIPSNGKWPQKVITWSLQDSAPGYLDKFELVDAFRYAFRQWDDVLDITFRQIWTERGAIHIEFGAVNGPDSPTLALGYYPPPINQEPIAGNIVFEYQKNWREIDIATVAIHEIGHTIGLVHSDNIKDNMYGGYLGVDRKLSEGDIRRAQLIYGAAAKAPTPKPKPQPKPTRFQIWFSRFIIKLFGK